MAVDAGLTPAAEGRRIRLSGVTQGVGLRPFIHRLARQCGVTGGTRNSSAGVTIEAFGSAQALERMLRGLQCGERPGAAAIERIDWEPLHAPAPAVFVIGSSAAGTMEGEPSIELAPDLASCGRCRAEIADPHDRRHRYAFTSCASCGPRFTIVEELPYERSATSMRAFPMCEACRHEYEDAGGRRHHAEASCCPECGPEVWLALLGGEASARGDAAVVAAAGRLASGAILAIRGLGGYHLACDAGDSGVVARLRAAKRRPRKPFAVMVRDLAEARRLAHVGAAEARLLESPTAPIVLLRRRERSPLVEAIAPELPWVGLMLPYTPLHHRLLELAARPLVMTSANRSGEPIVCTMQQAEERMAPLVDGFLHHDRKIAAPCDDSVVRLIAGRTTLLRRSRGHVPAALPLPRRLRQPVLACGAQLSSTICLGRGAQAWLSQHLGDLDSLEAADGHARAVERMERWLGVRPEIVAHDLHPGYTSTRRAVEREGAHCVAVQHHHAHAVSAMVEHALVEPALAIVLDGTGLGTDGHAWGGEVLLADYAGFERLASLRPIRLAGGDVAVREVWRLALALLHDAFDGSPPLGALALFRSLEPGRVEAVTKLLVQDFRCVPAHGAGRYFDAVGALVLGRAEAAHQADVATLLNAVADSAPARAYPFELRRVPAPGGELLELDLRATVRAIVADLGCGSAPGEIAARFHATLTEGFAAALERLRAQTGARPVVLSGGCFQNALLSERMQAALSRRFRVYAHERVPPGDGGLALGQLVVADAVVTRGGSGAVLTS